MKVKFDVKKAKEFFVRRIKTVIKWFSEIKKFIFLVLGYGVLINFMLWALFGFEFNFISLIGYGVLYYLIKEEFSEWFRRLFPEKRIR